MSGQCILADPALLAPKYIAEDESRRSCGSWPEFAATMTVCIDDFQDGLAKGRLHNFYFGEETAFTSLDQLLFALEEVMDRAEFPQRDTELRKQFGAEEKLTFQDDDEPKEPCIPAKDLGSMKMTRGRLANFYLRVCYRQHSSMQGYLSWAEGNGGAAMFRSEMELLVLLRETLRKAAEKVP